MRSRNFTAREKFRILQKCDAASWNTREVKRIARGELCHWTSIYGWKERFDGTEESLENLPPNNFQPRQHSKEQTAILQRTLAEFPSAGRMEIFARLRLEMGYRYSIRTMDREIRRQCFAVPVSEKVRAESQPYDTPALAGVKWQIDVKYVPISCMTQIPDSIYHREHNDVWRRFYQYTCIDEATRKRFMFIYERVGKDYTVDFMKRCILFFGYKPVMVQTDNGVEFAAFSEVGGHKTHSMRNGEYVHAFTRFLSKAGIEHKLIKVATPRHNGKVERSHRTDNEEFYVNFQGDNGFTSLDYARTSLKDWVYRYNNKRVMSVLGYQTPQAVETKMLDKLRAAEGRVTYTAIEHPKGSGNKSYKVEREGIVKFIPQSIEWAFAPREVQLT